MKSYPLRSIPEDLWYMIGVLAKLKGITIRKLIIDVLWKVVEVHRNDLGPLVKYSKGMKP